MEHDHEHGQEVLVRSDGSEELHEPWVVEGSERLAGAYFGAICVHEGADFEIARGSHHSGSLAFRPGSAGRILGRHAGSLHVPPDCDVEVIGDQSGSVHVEAGAVLKVAPGGKLAGSLDVAGLIENRGTRGGSVHQDGGEIRDLDGGMVKQPAISRDGTSVYHW